MAPRVLTRCRIVTRHEITSTSSEHTIALGAALGERLPAGAVLALSGDLGSGKTTLVRGLAGGLGIPEAEVASPTYVLLQAYEGGRLPLYHFDAWMEGREKALFMDGGDEWLHAGGVSCIEWAGRVGEWIPRPHVALALAHRTPEERSLVLEVVGAGPDGAGRGLESELEAALQDALQAVESAFPTRSGPVGDPHESSPPAEPPGGRSVPRDR